jgi:hypothetical protein
LTLPEAGFFESIEAIGNHLSLEIFGRLKECYERKEFEDFFQASRLFNKLRLGVFRDALDRHIDVEGIWKILKKYTNNDNSGCAVQAGRRIQVFGNLDFDIPPVAIQELRETLGLPFTLDYSSHTDGWESKGVKIEQWVSKGIYSEFTHSYEIVHILDSISSISLVKDTNYDNLKLYMKGLFIDAMKEQIYIQGKLLTSQEIKSKTMTIVIISLMLDNPDKCIHSSKIPMSSYSKNPSEMSSKIIAPLRQLFQQYFNLNFPITLDDNGQGFNVQLHTCSVPITILRKRNV